MSEDRLDTQAPADVQESSKDYVAPTLTDLGSFEELTGFGPSTNVDAEGGS